MKKSLKAALYLTAAPAAVAALVLAHAGLTRLIVFAPLPTLLGCVVVLAGLLMLLAD